MNSKKEGDGTPGQGLLRIRTTNKTLLQGRLEKGMENREWSQSLTKESEFGVIILRLI